jgi:dTMP kinase
VNGSPGRLVVLEGIDRSGRSTHAGLLEAHLRHHGRGATRTSLGSSVLSADALRRAKRGRRPDPVEIALLSAADLAERVERVVDPALRAGLVVVADRWTWTPIARAELRGVDRDWLDRLFSFAPAPDLVALLDLDPDASLARRDAPDPYEAGLDLHLADDLRESYRLFGTRLAGWFDAESRRRGWLRVPADEPVDRVEARLEAAVDRLTGVPGRRRGRSRSRAT